MTTTAEHLNPGRCAVVGCGKQELGTQELDVSIAGGLKVKVKLCPTHREQHFAAKPTP